MNNELYDKTMGKLQKAWRDNQTVVEARHYTPVGIRSSQIAALIILLIELGIIKE